ncbi:MAG: HNH endonuclease, partial [Nanoarchaeota archaeon]
QIKWQKEYSIRNKEKIAKNKKKYREKNKSMVSILIRNWKIRRKNEIKKKLGNRCKNCGFEDSRALQVNHKIVKTKEYREDYLVKDYDLNKVELLCANCHAIEHYEFYKNNTRLY